MPQNAKVRLDLLLLIILSSVVSGYALAGSFRLLAYFYTKPFYSYPVIFLLFAASTFFSFRWLQKFEAYRVFLLLIPAIGFVWLRLGYALYGQSYYVFNMVLYGLVILLGMGLAALVKIIVQNAGSKRLFLWFAAIPAFACGLFNQPDWMPWLCFALLCFVYARLFKRAMALLLISSLATLAVGWWLSALLPKPVFFESQKWHHDKVVFSKKTNFQRLDVTEWKGNHWFYQDGINHFSTIDSWLYFEPFVQPAMHLAPSRAKVLIIGGENGMIASTLRLFRPARIDLLPLDGEYLKIAGTNPYYTRQNEEVFASQEVNIVRKSLMSRFIKRIPSSLSGKNLKQRYFPGRGRKKPIVHADKASLWDSRLSTIDYRPSTINERISAFRWLKNTRKTYDVIFIDVPDPTNIELNQYYSLEFYQLARRALVENGLIITQSGSPYFATAAFQSIEKTLAAAKFSVTSYHNQVLTLGEWGWTMGMRADVDLKSKLWNHDYARAETKWFNQEAMRMMLSFGKPYATTTQTAINSLKNPVIYRLYNKGNNLIVDGR